MSLGRLLLRNLLFHWRGNLAVLLGVVVGTAVLTGALLVGDSLRGSLRDLTLRQLGWVENAMISGRFVRDRLADEISTAGPMVPVVLLQGSVEADDKNPKRRVAKVTILGVDNRFWEHYHAEGPWGGATSIVTLNASLARELGVTKGDAVTLRVQKASDVHRETWVGRSDASDTVGELPLTVSEVLPDDSPAGRFNLRPAASTPRNAFVPLRTLQKALGVGDRVNALLTGPADPRQLQAELKKHLTLDDWGLVVTDPDMRAERFFHSLDARKVTSLRKFRWEGRVPDELAKQAKDGVLTLDPFKEYYRRHHDYLSLESKQLLLDRAVEDSAKGAAEDAKLQAAPTLVYLANTITTESVELGALAAALDPAPLSVIRATTPAFFRIPYSVVAAVPPEKPAPMASPFHPSFSERRLGDDTMILADWKESPLPIHAGDRIIVQYFDPERHGNLGERSAVFRLGSAAKGANPTFAPFESLDNADPDLTPTLPGITDKLDLRTWDPPFPYNNRRVKPRDEEYWKRYRTTPKAYVSLAAGQELWTSRFGRLTSVRLAIPHDRTAKQARDDFERALLARLTPEQGGFVFNPIRAEAIKASSQGTDFGGLFLGFSFFLIAAALLLVGLLTRLSLDRRAAEAGLLFAVGYRRRVVRRLLLIEGTILAAVGALVGCVAAVGYAWLMLELLRFLWPGGLEQSFLRLHVTPLSFAIGYGSALAVSVGTIFWAVRALGKASPTLLLQGEVRGDERVASSRPPRRVSLYVLEVSVITGLGCLFAAPYTNDPEAKAGLFFGGGFLLLVAGLTGMWMWMKRDQHRPVRGHGWPALARLGCRNATRNPLRSLLTAGLLAAAAFLIVAVDSFRRKPDADFLEKTAGSGGFIMLAESDLPIFDDLNTPEGRNKLNFSKEVRDGLRGVKIYPLRLRGGDDASCLNLYQPRRPRLLGVPRRLIDRGGFHFAATEAKTPEAKQDPWQLLLTPPENGVVPVFGEKNTIDYMLHSGLGDDKTVGVPDQQGVDHRLRVVGLLQDSVFQGELLTSEENFLKLYPDHAGYNFFLIEAPADRAEKVKELLQTALADFGFKATPTRDRLQTYLNVENTYLSTFQVLGSLGLLLGALGLAVVLLRNVWERRAELALLRALGYRPRALGWLVLAENAFLLLIGLIVGTAAALLSVAPRLSEVGGEVPVLRLLAVLGLVLAVGLAAGLGAVRATLQTPLLPALRKE